MGLANAIAEELLVRALELAANVAGLSLESLRHTKELLNACACGGSLADHFEIEILSQAMCSFSREPLEASEGFRKRERSALVVR